jgi:hypothetical protein
MTSFNIYQTEITRQAISFEELELLKLRGVCKYHDMWYPPPSNLLREKHIKTILVPQIPLESLHLSARVRGKEFLGKTKMDLAYMLADDIEFERKELGESKHKEIRLEEQEIMVIIFSWLEVLFVR